MPKTFKNYIFSGQIILVSIIFLICFVFSTYLHTTLTKQEALKALEEGKKITHRYFPEDQYYLKYLKEIRENHYSYI